MLAIHCLQHLQLIALLLCGQSLILQIFNRLRQQIVHLDPRIPNRSALIRSWQEAGTVVLGSTMSQARSDSNKSRQALVLRAQTIRNPGAHAGTWKGVGAGMQLKDSSAVSDTVSHHRSDHAYIIDEIGRA